MTELHAISPGIVTVLALWVLWLLLDPALRPGNLSWTHLILWLLTPLGMYLGLASHSYPPDPPASPVGKEGTIAQLSPLEVEVFGSFWPARCRHAEDLRLGQRVRVVERQGLTLVVERLS
ncbi:MAG: NfeD family protein [Vicinamibacteria bacterium]|nr:NfeD family protein [Vicinamibacteria bacterium]